MTGTVRIDGREVGRVTVAQPVDGETGLAQADGQAIAEFGIVFNEQDAHEPILSACQPPAGGDDCKRCCNGENHS